MFFNYQNISIYYKKYGTGRQPMVILPGWGDTRDFFFFNSVF